MAAPTKYTPAIVDEIIEAIEQGNRGEVAAEAAGISEQCFYNWMAKGRAGEPDFVEFLERVTRARAAAEKYAVAALRKGFDADAKYAVEFLKRARNKHWSEKQEIDMRVGELDKLSDEEIARQHAEMVARVTKGKADAE